MYNAAETQATGMIPGEKQKKAPDNAQRKTRGNASGSGWARRFFTRAGFVLFAAFIAALAVLAGIRLHSFDPSLTGRAGASGFEVRDESAGAARIRPGESGDVGEIRRECGFPMPYFPGQVMFGEMTNVPYDGKNAVRVTMSYPGGVVIQAVRPREAVFLIKREGLEVQLYESLRVPFGRISSSYISALMCGGKEGSCIFFSTEDAAYSIFGPVDGETLYRYIYENDLDVR